jgi:membrane-bound serine protease (ClpP class)
MFAFLATIDINWLYIVLIATLWVAATAVYIPGTTVLETLTVGGIFVSLFAFSQHPTAWWAVMLIVVGTLFFKLAPVINNTLSNWAWFGLLAQTVASFFLFEGAQVSPIIIIMVTLLSFAYYQFLLLPVLERMRTQTSTNEDDLLLGAEGRVTTAISDQVGTVQLRGEAWTAYSDNPIAVGERVRVIRREGLQLYVERVKRKGARADENNGESTENSTTPATP